MSHLLSGHSLRDTVFRLADVISERMNEMFRDVQDPENMNRFQRPAQNFVKFCHKMGTFDIIMFVSKVRFEKEVRESWGLGQSPADWWLV